MILSILLLIQSPLPPEKPKPCFNQLVELRNQEREKRFKAFLALKPMTFKNIEEFKRQFKALFLEK